MSTQTVLTIAIRSAREQLANIRLRAMATRDDVTQRNAYRLMHALRTSPGVSTLADALAFIADHA
jgi:hypothetical protein